MYLCDTLLGDAEVFVTLHAKKRLYERFGELCAITNGLGETIESMLRMGFIVDARANSGGLTLMVSFGDVGLVVSIGGGNLFVVTVVNSQLWSVCADNSKLTRKLKKRRVVNVKSKLNEFGLMGGK